MMSGFSFQLGGLIATARTAGEILSRYFRRGMVSHRMKAGRANVVTEADLESQRAIIERLSRLFPRVPIVGEEDESTGGADAEMYFLVDPLDGTLNFLHGIPFFSVSIALMQGETPLVGVVYAPVLDELFYATRGAGAFLNGRRLGRRGKRSIREAIAVTGWPYDPTLLSWAQRSLSLVQKEVQEVRILGTSSLEMCYIAAGFIDVYWEVGLYPWDLAAGWAIVTEAGGMVTDPAGGEFDLRSGRVLATGCTSLHHEMLRILEPIVGELDGI